MQHFKLRFHALVRTFAKLRPSTCNSFKASKFRQTSPAGCKAEILFGCAVPNQRATTSTLNVDPTSTMGNVNNALFQNNVLYYAAGKMLLDSADMRSFHFVLKE